MQANFVAINTITCDSSYIPRFKELFTTRAHAIDRLDGFISMQVLEPKAEGEPYLVVSQWSSEEAFQGWLKSPEFEEGHRRAFEDLRLAKERGEQPPMHSKFMTYEVLTN